MTSSVDRYEDEGTICRAPTLAGAPSSFRRFCLCRSEGGAFRWPRLAGAVDLQMVQRDVLRPQRLQLDFGVVALGHLPPAIDVRFALDVYRWRRSEEHTSELQSRGHLVCRLLLEKKKVQTGESVNVCQQ